MQLLYGKPIADKILNRLKSEIEASEEKPGLAVILVGSNEASKIYVSLKEKMAHEIGMNFFRYDLEENVSQAQIMSLVGKLNYDDKVHGIIVQLPLPEGISSEKIISRIDPEKDVDGFHCRNVECFIGGRQKIKPVFPSAIMLLIESSGENIENKNALVVANSDEFGRVMVAALDQKGVQAEYFLSGDIASNLGKIGKADIVISAVGLKGLLSGEILKEGAIVIDGGIEKVGDRIVGDVDFASTEKKYGYITPVPGGVGPVTIACLLENVYLAFKAQQKH